MTVMKFMRPVVFMSALALSTPVFAQQAVTTTDIQRLQDQVYDASNEVSRRRGRDQASADRLQTQLYEFRDEVIYLRVKMRKEGSVSRNDYNDVRSRIDSIRSDARTNSTRTPAADTQQGNGNWTNGASSAPVGSSSGSTSGGTYGSGGSNTGYGSGSGSTSSGSNSGGYGSPEQARP